MHGDEKHKELPNAGTRKASAALCFPEKQTFSLFFYDNHKPGDKFSSRPKKRVSQDNEAIDFWHALQIVPIPPFHYKLCAGDKKVERKRDLSNDEK